MFPRVSNDVLRIPIRNTRVKVPEASPKRNESQDISTIPTCCETWRRCWNQPLGSFSDTTMGVNQQRCWCHWIGLREHVNRKAPWSSGENRWFPVDFPLKSLNPSIDLLIFFLNIDDPRYTKVHGTQTPNNGGKLGVHSLAMAASECHGVSKTLGRRMPFEKGPL